MGGVAGERFSRPSPLDSTHEVSAFACGNDALDDWLRLTALKAEGRSARTYVVCQGDVVAGYYCLATGAIARVAAPGRLRRNAPDPIPVMIVGRLAVDALHHGRGIGGGMLRDALQRVLQATEIVGCRAVLVHAIDEAAVAFYAQYGFREFPAGARTLFLPIEDARAAL